MYAKPCNIATSMWRAEAAWRQEPAKVSIAQVVADAAQHIDEARKQETLKWIRKALEE